MPANYNFVKKWNGKTNIPGDGIEFDRNLINIDEVKALSKQIEYLAKETPNPRYYADSWLKTSLDDSEISPDKMPSKEEVSNFFSSLPEKFHNRNNMELFYLRLLQAKNLIEPLIFIESGLRKVKVGKDFELVEHILDQNTILKELERDIFSYKTTLGKLHLIDDLKIYVESLPLTNGTTYNKHRRTISRAQYAFMVMVISGLPVKYSKLAVFNCKSYLTSIKKEKLTKITVHTLCCIIYRLLIEHAKNKEQKKKAYCRVLTAQILNAFSPKKANGKPYYNIDKGGVDYALTGK
jgi:hypothetical protein